MLGVAARKTGGLKNNAPVSGLLTSATTLVRSVHSSRLGHAATRLRRLFFG